MRRSSALEALFPEVRRGILAATLTHPDKWWYLSELAQFLGTRPSSLQRELGALVGSGILQQRRDGNRAYFKADAKSPFYRELRSLLEKTAGLMPTLRQLLEPFRAQIDCAFVYGSVARGREHGRSDIDLMVIGRLGLAELSAGLRKAETRLGRDINVTSYTHDDFREKVANDHFLGRILRERKQFVVGNLSDLDKVIGKQRRPATSDVEEGTR